jgi:hypothetical protein
MQDRLLREYYGEPDFVDISLQRADRAVCATDCRGRTLLIADHVPEQGRSVAYLTGMRQLAERVEDEAGKLGLDVVRFASKDYGGPSWMTPTRLRPSES